QYCALPIFALSDFDQPRHLLRREHIFLNFFGLEGVESHERIMVNQTFLPGAFERSSEVFFAKLVYGPGGSSFAQEVITKGNHVTFFYRSNTSRGTRTEEF